MAKKIMWDKGHGGTDPGTVGNGLQEKVLTHKIVEYAMAYMSANYTGFEQRTTRSGDQTVSLNNRDDEANTWGADIFVSVHINSGGGTGFESYIWNGNMGSSAAATVALQNMVHNEVLAAMRQFGNITDRGKKRQNFAVLRETNMPAVLTENLFIDTSDSNYLKNESFLKAVGEAHAIGVAKYLGLPSKPQITSFVSIETGGVEQDKINEMSAYILSKGWSAKLLFFKDAPAYFEIGWFEDPSPDLSELLSWLSQHGWHYIIVKH